MHFPKNLFKAGLGADRIPYGIWTGFANAYAAEIVASTGYDWMLIDGEHAPNDVVSMLAQLQAVAAYSTRPIVRLVSGDPMLIKQVLDIGAQTLMVPMVEDAAQARQVVQGMHYPPRGKRGIGGGLARATRWDGVPDYLPHASDELCLVLQIESKAGVDQADRIAAVDGVDAIFIGPADLSCGLGHPNDPGHPDVQTAIRHVIDVTRRCDKACGILAPNEDDARRYAAWGCSFVAVGIDISLLRRGAIDSLARFGPRTDDGSASPVPASDTAVSRTY